MPHYRRDDRDQDVQVEFQKSDLRVRSRRGYLDLSRRAPYNATLTLRRKPHDLVVALHDPVSDQTVSTRTRVSFR